MESTTIIEAIVDKLRYLPTDRQQAVLDFTDSLKLLASGGEPFDFPIYAYTDEERKVLWKQGQELLYGPSRPAAEAEADFRARHGLADKPLLSEEELEAQYDAMIAGWSPEKKDEMIRLGFL